MRLQWNTLACLEAKEIRRASKLSDRLKGP